MQGKKESQILLNNDWLVKPRVIIDCEGLHILTCKFHDGGYNLFSPRNFYDNVLNSYIPDLLAHYVGALCASKQMKTRTYSTTFAMVQCRTFLGIDTVSIGIHNSFNNHVESLGQRKCRYDNSILRNNKI